MLLETQDCASRYRPPTEYNFPTTSLGPSATEGVLSPLPLLHSWLWARHPDSAVLARFGFWDCRQLRKHLQHMGIGDSKYSKTIPVGITPSRVFSSLSACSLHLCPLRMSGLSLLHFDHFSLRLCLMFRQSS